MKLPSGVLCAAGVIAAWLVSGVPAQAQSAGGPPPTNVWAAQIGPRDIVLVWRRAPRALGYRIYPVGSTPKRGVPAQATGKNVDQLPIPVVPSYHGSYSYRIAAVYGGGTLSKKVSSNTIVPVLDRPPGTIAPPTSVRAAETGSGVITVSWSPVTGATGYLIGRAVAPNGLKMLCQVCPTVPKYVDRDVTAGAKHTYAVAALTPTGPTRRTRSNDVTPTGSGSGGAGGADSSGTDSTRTDSTATDSSGTVAVDTLLPHGVRLFTARNERGQVQPLVRLTWSRDPTATRYLIAFVDTVDDVHYGPQELFAERTIYTGTDTAAILNAPGDTARLNYAIVSENAHGRSQPRYATGAANPSPKDSVTPADSAPDVANQGPEGVRNLRVTFTPYSGGATADLRWSVDPRAIRYYLSGSEGTDRPIQFAVKRGSDTTELVAVALRDPMAEYRFQVISEDLSGRKSPPRFVSGIPGTPSDSARAADSIAALTPEGVTNLKVTFVPYPGGAAAHLRWTVDPRATRYHISGSEGTDPWSEFAVRRGSDTTEVVAVTPRDPKAEYRFQVVSEDGSGKRSPPRIVSGIPGTAPDSALTASGGQLPQGVRDVTATYRPAGEWGTVELTWSPDPYAAKYRLSSAGEAGRFTEFQVVPASVTSAYVAMAPEYKSGAVFQIISEDSYGHRSAPSVSNKVVGRPPKGGTRLVVTPARSGDGMELKWDYDPTVAQYVIARSDDGGPFREIARLISNYSSYVDRNPAGRSVTYQIVYRNGYGELPPLRSEPLDWRRSLPPRGVTSPTAALETGKVHLRWNADERAERYEIRKSINGRAATQIAVLSGDKTEYSDPQPVGLAQVTYEIVSANQVGSSAPVPFPQSFGRPRDTLDLRSGGDSTGPVIKP